MILIYSKKRDEFINRVIDWLGNDPFFRISIDNGFVYKGSSFNSSMDYYTFVENNYNGKINLNNVKSIWFHGGTLDYERTDSQELDELLNENLNLVIDGMLNCKPVNKIGSLKNNKNANKINNLLAAKNIGIRIPETLITSCKKTLVKFIKKNENIGVISKRINDFDSYFENDYLFDNSKTFLITNKILKDLPFFFGLSLFQKRIKKKYEVRVVYFNRGFSASAIFDNSNNIDYRSNLNNITNKPRIVPYNLPSEIEKKLQELVTLLDYSFCSIDLIYDINDRYVFLEINPAGHIGYISSACNFYLERDFAEYLGGK